MVPGGSTGREDPTSLARGRVINLLSRHPDLVAGRFEKVAVTICDEASLALDCRRVGLWHLAGDEVVEEAWSGKRFEDLEKRRLSRSAAPAFFTAIECRGRLQGRGIHELATLAPDAAVLSILVEGSTWGFLTLEGNERASAEWLDGELDFAHVLAVEAGRCVERGRAADQAHALERTSQALSSFARMSGDVLCFEVVEGTFEFFGDPRAYLGPAPSGVMYGTDHLLSHLREGERELLERRYDDWVEAGAPGVLTARVHFRLGPEGDDAREVELEWRFLRTRATGGHRLWGTLRRT